MLEIDFSLYETNLPQVTSFKIFTNTKGEFDENGLYSQRIFGPIKNYECKCGQLKGKQYRGETCPKCKVKCISSDARLHTFAQIKLPFGVKIVLPPLKYIGNKIFGKTVFDKILKFDPHIYDNEEYYYYDLNKRKLRLAEEISDPSADHIVDEFKVYNIMDLFKLYVYLMDNHFEIFAENNISRDIAKHLFQDKVIVTPPDTRPVAKISAGKYSVNDITRHYVEILKNIKNSFTDEIYAKMQIEDQRNIYLASSSRKFQYSVDQIFSIVLEKNLGQKESIVRQSLLGKTLEFSGRAVITCGPNVPPYMISMDTYGLSKLAILEILNYMLENNIVDVGDIADVMQLLTIGIEHTDINIDKDLLEDILEKIRLDLRMVVERPPVLFYYNDSTMLLDKTLDSKLKRANAVLEESS